MSDGDHSWELWLSSITNAVVALAVIAYTLKMGKLMPEVIAEVDAATATMSDFTVMLKPTMDRRWDGDKGCDCGAEEGTDYSVQDGKTKADQENLFKQEIKDVLEKEFGTTATIGGKDAIWIAWVRFSTDFSIDYPLIFD